MAQVQNLIQATKVKPAKPFLKWAGGKTQLLGQFEQFFPQELKDGKIKKYIEPFIGSGAVFFQIVQKYQIEKSYIYDINEELILVYRVIKKDVNSLIDILTMTQETYYELNESDKYDYYYCIRDEYNKRNYNKKKYSEDWIHRAAQMIFMNKTCFNGLFRLNSKGEFNVPFGRYKNPKILDEENLVIVSEVLKDVIIKACDFTNIEKLVDDKSFIYFDPPYRPISRTASFTSYSKNNFSEEEQKRLSFFYKALDKTGAKLMLSNSDPKNENPDDNFFEHYYKKFHVNQVDAHRMINCDASKRGQIKELVITNY